MSDYTLPDHDLNGLAARLSGQRPIQDLLNASVRLDGIATSLTNAANSPTWAAVAGELRDTVRELRQIALRQSLETLGICEEACEAISDLHTSVVAAQRLTQQAANIRTAGDCDELSATARGILAQVQSLRAQIEREGAREDGSRAA